MTRTRERNSKSPEANELPFASKDKGHVAPEDDRAHVGLTSARRLLTLGRDAEAAAAFIQSATIPGIDTAALYEGTAQAMRNQGQLVEAMRLLDAGLLRFPGHASMRFIRSLMLLGLGRFGEGWPEYEHRFKSPQRCYMPRAVSWPRWNGKPSALSLSFENDHILVWSEQGFGDEIMFASLIPQLNRHQVTFECSRDTAPLFRRSFPNVRVFPVELNGAMPEGLAGEPFDYECPLGSLPLALGLDRPGKCDAWLKTDPALTSRLRADLEKLATGRRIVGVSWRGGTNMTRHIARSLTFTQLKPILDIPYHFYVVIQHDMKTDEVLNVAKMLPLNRLDFFPNMLTQLDSLVALIGACDEIVTVCGTNVHLAGAMGKKVTVLAPHAPEWRYGFTGDYMPWYQHVKVFRQPKYGDWDSVIASVANELAAHA